MKANKTFLSLLFLLVSVVTAGAWSYTARTGLGRVTVQEVAAGLGATDEEVREMVRENTLQFRYEYLNHSLANCAKDLPNRTTMYKQFERTWGFQHDLSWTPVVPRTGFVNTLRFNGIVSVIDIPYEGCPAGWYEYARRTRVSREANLYVNGFKIPQTTTVSP